MNIDQIREAVVELQAAGGNLKQETWGVEWNDLEKKWVVDRRNCFCPLGAILLKHQPPANPKLNYPNNCSDAIANFFNVGENDVESFVEGFDGTIEATEKYSQMGRLLGEEFGIPYLEEGGTEIFDEL